MSRIIPLKPPPEDFLIEDSIPVPPDPRGNRRFPFHKMEIGQSFAVPSTQTSVRSAACSYSRHHGKKFTTRIQGDIIRVWRIK